MKRTFLSLTGIVLGAVICFSAAAEEDRTITVAASPWPHTIILQKAGELLEEDGWRLEIEIFEDEIQPNMVVDSGETDACFIQDSSSMEQFNEEYGTQLVSAGEVDLGTFGIPSGEIQVIAVKKGKQNSEKIKALTDAVTSRKIRYDLVKELEAERSSEESAYNKEANEEQLTESLTEPDTERIPEAITEMMTEPMTDPMTDPMKDPMTDTKTAVAKPETSSMPD